MTQVKTISERLKILGIDVNKPATIIIEDLLNLSEYLCEDIEMKEIERFQKELNRVLKPNN